MASADLALQISGQLLWVETTQEARLSVAAQAGTKRVAFSAVGDSCPLCEALDGKVFWADGPEAAMYTPPLHINCNCIWTAVGDDEVGAMDLFDANDQQIKDLAAQHGGLIEREGEELKYKALKIPARPDGRDFTFRRAKDPQSGELRSEIVWNRPRYPIEGLAPGTVQTGVTDVGQAWVASGGQEPQ